MFGPLGAVSVVTRTVLFCLGSRGRVGLFSSFGLLSSYTSGACVQDRGHGFKGRYPYDTLTRLVQIFVARMSESLMP